MSPRFILPKYMHTSLFCRNTEINRLFHLGDQFDTKSKLELNRRGITLTRKDFQLNDALELIIKMKKPIELNISLEQRYGHQFGRKSYLESSEVFKQHFSTKRIFRYGILWLIGFPDDLFGTRDILNLKPRNHDFHLAV